MSVPSEAHQPSHSRASSGSQISSYFAAPSGNDDNANPFASIGSAAVGQFQGQLGHTSPSAPVGLPPGPSDQFGPATDQTHPPAGPPIMMGPYPSQFVSPASQMGPPTGTSTLVPPAGPCTGLPSDGGYPSSQISSMPEQSNPMYSVAEKPDSAPTDHYFTRVPTSSTGVLQTNTGDGSQQPLSRGSAAGLFGSDVDNVDFFSTLHQPQSLNIIAAPPADAQVISPVQKSISAPATSLIQVLQPSEQCHPDMFDSPSLSTSDHSSEQFSLSSSHPSLLSSGQPSWSSSVVQPSILPSNAVYSSGQPSLSGPSFFSGQTSLSSGTPSLPPDHQSQVDTVTAYGPRPDSQGLSSLGSMNSLVLTNADSNVSSPHSRPPSNADSHAKMPVFCGEPFNVVNYQQTNADPEYQCTTQKRPLTNLEGGVDPDRKALDIEDKSHPPPPPHSSTEGDRPHRGVPGGDVVDRLSSTSSLNHSLSSLLDSQEDFTSGVSPIRLMAPAPFMHEPLPPVGPPTSLTRDVQLGQLSLLPPAPLPPTTAIGVHTSTGSHRAGINVIQEVSLPVSSSVVSQVSAMSGDGTERLLAEASAEEGEIAGVGFESLSPGHPNPPAATKHPESHVSTVGGDPNPLVAAEHPESHMSGDPNPPVATEHPESQVSSLSAGTSPDSCGKGSLNDWEIVDSVAEQDPSASLLAGAPPPQGSVPPSQQPGMPMGMHGVPVSIMASGVVNVAPVPAAALLNSTHPPFQYQPECAQFPASTALAQEHAPDSVPANPLELSSPPAVSVSTVHKSEKLSSTCGSGRTSVGDVTTTPHEAVSMPNATFSPILRSNLTSCSATITAPPAHTATVSSSIEQHPKPDSTPSLVGMHESPLGVPSSVSPANVLSSVSPASVLSTVSQANVTGVSTVHPSLQSPEVDQVTVSRRIEENPVLLSQGSGSKPCSEPYVHSISSGLYVQQPGSVQSEVPMSVRQLNEQPGAEMPSMVPQLPSMVPQLPASQPHQSLPQPLPPQPLVPQPTPQSLPPHSLVPQSLPPHSLVPQALPHQSLPPHSLVPQPLPHQSLPPQPLVPQPLPPQSLPPHSLVPQPLPPQSLVPQPLPPPQSLPPPHHPLHQQAQPLPPKPQQLSSQHLPPQIQHLPTAAPSVHGGTIPTTASAMLSAADSPSESAKSALYAHLPIPSVGQAQSSETKLQERAVDMALSSESGPPESSFKPVTTSSGIPLESLDVSLEESVTDTVERGDSEGYSVASQPPRMHYDDYHDRGGTPKEGYHGGEYDPYYRDPYDDRYRPGYPDPYHSRSSHDATPYGYPDRYGPPHGCRERHLPHHPPPGHDPYGRYPPYDPYQHPRDYYPYDPHRYEGYGPPYHRYHPEPHHEYPPRIRSYEPYVDPVYDREVGYHYRRDPHGYSYPEGGYPEDYSTQQPPSATTLTSEGDTAIEPSMIVGGTTERHFEESRVFDSPNTQMPARPQMPPLDSTYLEPESRLPYPPEHGVDGGGYGQQEGGGYYQWDYPDGGGNYDNYQGDLNNTYYGGTGAVGQWEEPQPATPPPPARDTPEIFSCPHVRTTLCFGGKLVTVLPSNVSAGDPAVVEIMSIGELLKDEESREFVGAVEEFTGPFIPRDTPKATVVNFASTNAQLCGEKGKALISSQGAGSSLAENVSAEGYEDEVLLWGFLVLLCQQNGMVMPSDVAELLVKDCPLTFKSAPHFEVQGQQESLDSLRNLLLSGRKKDALDFACSRSLWGHALMLASRMDDQSRTYVVNRFTASLVTTDPLNTFYTLLIGRTPSSVKPEGLSRAGDWRPHLSMILANKSTKLETASIMSLGDSLMGRKRLQAAHLCYYLADVHFGSYGDLDARYSLLGVDHTLLETGVYPRPQDLRKMEVFEYAMCLTKQDFTMPAFQVFKLLHMFKLVEYGFLKMALKYCEQVGQIVMKQIDKYVPTFLKALVSLSVRLHHFASDFSYTETELPSWLYQLEHSVEALLSTGYTPNQLSPSPAFSSVSQTYSSHSAQIQLVIGLQQDSAHLTVPQVASLSRSKDTPPPSTSVKAGEEGLEYYHNEGGSKEQLTGGDGGVYYGQQAGGTQKMGEGEYGQQQVAGVVNPYEQQQPVGEEVGGNLDTYGQYQQPAGGGGGSGQQTVTEGAGGDGGYSWQRQPVNEGAVNTFQQDQSEGLDRGQQQGIVNTFQPTDGTGGYSGQQQGIMNTFQPTDGTGAYSGQQQGIMNTFQPTDGTGAYSGQQQGIMNTFQPTDGTGGYSGQQQGTGGTMNTFGQDQPTDEAGLQQKLVEGM